MSMILHDDFYGDSRCDGCEYKRRHTAPDVLEARIAELNELINKLRSEYIDTRSMLLWKNRYSSDYIVCCDRARQDYDRIIQESKI